MFSEARGWIREGIHVHPVKIREGIHVHPVKIREGIHVHLVKGEREIDGVSDIDVTVSMVPFECIS
jgi:hypothetical protein